MKLSSLWHVHGEIDGRTERDVYVLADTFEEAARLAPEALQYGWGVRDVPPVEVVSVDIVHREVRV